ncbi:MAG TPA: DMT family transporter [Patescibacteria group bacterium]|nr:DMT family transporter [Patescibacteria group bacterium]
MTWLFWATSSILFFSALILLQRTLSIDSKYPRAMAVVFNFWGILFALLISFATGAYRNISFPSEPVAWIFMFTAVIMYSLFERGRFLASKLLEASVTATISNISLVVAFVGSIFLYSEALTFGKIVGTALILLALVLVATAGGIHKKVPLKSLGIGVIISVFLGLAWMLDKKGALFFSPDLYNILVWLLPLFFVYFPYIKNSELKYEALRGSWKLILLAGINVTGYLLQLKALETGDATRIIPIVQTSTLITVLMGILFLKEREHVWRKIISSIIALAGVFFLVANTF